MSENSEMKITLAALLAAINGDMDNAIVAATPGGIEKQERAGQAAMVSSEILPKDGSDSIIYAALGIEILGDYDDLFYSVKLPEGWHKIADGHAMWSYLVDDKGRRRAPIFYKAAFYDRKAHITFECRYRYGDRPVGGWGTDSDTEAWEGFVSDCGQDIFVTEPTETVNREHRYATSYHAQKQTKRAEAEAWLMEHYPNYANPLAYW